MSKVETTLYSIGDDKLIAIADAIRSQTETEDTMTTDDMVTKINNMLNAIEPYLLVLMNEIDTSKIYLQLVEEPADPESGFDPTERPCYQLMYEDPVEGDIIWDPDAGVLARQGGENKYLTTEDISVSLTLTNPDDERDVHTFHGHYMGGAYAFQDWDEDSDQYEIQFDSWPQEAITYDCTLSATYYFGDYTLKNDSVSVEFEFTLEPNPFDEGGDEPEEEPEEL